MVWTLANPPASGLRGICGEAGAHGGTGPGSLKLSTRVFVPQEALPEPFEHLLQRIARRPKPQQFFGLMGKRDAGEKSNSHYQAIWLPDLHACSFLKHPSLAYPASINFHAKRRVIPRQL